MINREDILELTRRATLSCTSFTRIAGCYVDRDGDLDESLNINLLELSTSERTRKLRLVKEVPFAATNVNLEKYEYSQSARELESIWQLLMAINECGLKNDTLMDTFYDVVMEHYRAGREYAILVFHDRYDIPAKGSDKERQRELEGMLEYMICVVYPLSGEYRPDKLTCGFLFPTFMDRSGNLNHINVFQTGTGRSHNEILKFLEVI